MTGLRTGHFCMSAPPARRGMKDDVLFLAPTFPHTAGEGVAAGVRRAAFVCRAARGFWFFESLAFISRFGANMASFSGFANKSARFRRALLSAEA